MDRDKLEFKLCKMAFGDYSALVAQEKCFDPEVICSEVNLCQEGCGKEECEHNFIILTLGPTETVIGRYQFTCDKSGEILGMKRLYGQLFKPIEFHGAEKVNK